MKRPAAPLVVVFFLLGCFFLNRAAADSFLGARPAAGNGTNPLIEALGEMKVSIGDMLYLKSDAYFHGGLDARLVPAEEHEEGDEHAGHAEPIEPVSGLPSDWIGRINRQIRIVDHRHLNETDAQEILPLLSAAARLDPANTDVSLSAAYWIRRKTGRVEDAIRVLEQSLLDNPSGWPLHLELGDLYLHHLRQAEPAAEHYKRAIMLLKKDESEAFKTVLAHMGLGQSLEAMGRTEEASHNFMKALELYPSDKGDTAMRRELEAKTALFQRKS